MEQFDVTREQIAAVLEFVAQRLKTTIPPQVLELVNAHFRAAVMEGKTYADRCCGHAKHQRLSENITKAVRGNSRFNLNSEVER